MAEGLQVSGLFKGKGGLLNDASSQNALKSSVQRAVRGAVMDQMPALENVLDEIWPKKAAVTMAKCEGHVNIYLVDGVPLFFQRRDGPLFPTLRLLMNYPAMLPRYQVDRGAIKFVLKGSNIMAPGLTKEGETCMADGVDAERAVAVFAFGKEHPIAVGLTKQSAVETRTHNKGIAVDNVHFLNDGLWKTTTAIR